jgi:acetyl esterase/lipase
MTLWPAEYEAFREEARAAGRASMEYYTGHLSGVDPVEQLTVGRKMLAEHEQEAPGGRDEVIAGVPCRTFDPAGDERRGTYLHLHGGAMTLGSPRMNDVSNAALSERLEVRVVSVDYRLAPEHPFPAGPDDCLTVARWVLEQEHGLIAIGGESAGAYFAALTLLRIRDELDAVERISGANLVFGVYDLSRTPSSRGTSPSTALDGMANGESGMREMYVPGRSSEDLRDPAISPLYADLRRMPPALFTTGTADYLLDDSLFMSARWQAYGNQAELAVYPDCVHGFTGLPITLADRANARIGQFLTDTFGGTSNGARA